MLTLAISQRLFELYALSLERGPNFDPRSVIAAWECPNGSSVGALLIHHDCEEFSVIVLRRQVDHRFVVTYEKHGLPTESDALLQLTNAMRVGEPPESVPPGVKKRKSLVAPTKKAGEFFRLLTGTIEHLPALMTVGEVYLAMPNPDDNFVPDFQTSNFHSRLWELYLVACFREQGVLVSQVHHSPDFYLQRDGHECYVEAVTANPSGEREQGFPKPVLAPQNIEERTLGQPAVRFAKTLRSKLQLNYEQLAHVRGKPFALALADFQAPGSMVWTREALPSYLYGLHIQVENTKEGKKAVGRKVDTLKSAQNIPAGLFRDESTKHLSAILFSNAATLGKFNRMGYLAGFRPPNLRMVRRGILYDRTPGALEPIPFDFDILSDEYAALWPGGEAWCQELEVFHNPLAEYPLNFELLPGATHWYEENGEVVCSSMWQWSVLASVTTLLPAK